MKTELILQDKIRSFTSQCLLQGSKLNNEKSIAGIVRCIQVYPDSLIMHAVRPQTNELKRKAELRAEELIKKAMGDIHRCSSNDEKISLINSARRDWMSLRGNFPRLSASCERFLMTQISQIRKADLDLQPKDNENSPGI